MIRWNLRCGTPIQLKTGTMFFDLGNRDSCTLTIEFLQPMNKVPPSRSFFVFSYLSHGAPADESIISMFKYSLVAGGLLVLMAHQGFVFMTQGVCGCISLRVPFKITDNSTRFRMMYLC
jgi:hypothetical protein